MAAPKEPTKKPTKKPTPKKVKEVELKADEVNVIELPRELEAGEVRCDCGEEDCTTVFGGPEENHFVPLSDVSNEDHGVVFSVMAMQAGAGCLVKTREPDIPDHSMTFVPNVTLVDAGCGKYYKLVVR